MQDVINAMNKGAVDNESHLQNIIFWGQFAAKWTRLISPVDSNEHGQRGEFGLHFGAASLDSFVQYCLPFRLLLFGPLTNQYRLFSESLSWYPTPTFGNNEHYKLYANFMRIRFQILRVYLHLAQPHQYNDSPSTNECVMSRLAQNSNKAFYAALI